MAISKIGFSATKERGQKTTLYAQSGVTGPLSGQLGLCGAVMEDTAACRAAVASFLPHGTPSVKGGACNSPQNMDVYNRYEPEVGPLRPVYSDATDMCSFIRAMTACSSDVEADIVVLSGPISSLRASVSAWSRENTKDITADIFGFAVTSGNVYANIIGVISTHTASIEYEESIITTPGGFSVLYRLLTTMPDLTASIYGWDYSDMVASITPAIIYMSYLTASIIPVVPTPTDLPASITATYTNDIGASTTPVPYVTIGGVVQSVTPFDLDVYIEGYRPKDLFAFGGGHYPEDIGALLTVNLPSDLKAWLRVGGEGPEDIGASIAASGGYSNLPAGISAAIRSNSDLPTSITCRIPFDLIALIHGRAEADITAWIKGVYSSDIGGWVTGWSRLNTSDMVAFTRASWGLQSDVETFIYGWVSTHTSDKPYNRHLYNRLPQRILIGTKGGLTFLRVEVIWGTFPDLHATITPRQLFIADMRAYVLPVEPIHRDLYATLNAVTSVVVVSKIPINLVNLSDLSVYISAFSGYSAMPANISGVAETSTSTPPGSGWVYKSSSVRFYIGTTKGLVVPTRQERILRPEVFLNYSLTPDLWAFVYGWQFHDLSAYISVQPYTYLYGSITPQDTSHIYSLSASLTSYYTSDFVASITGSGGFTGISASISSLGGASDLSATIQPYLKILGYRLISVQTQPFFDLRAIVNPVASCAAYSTYSNLSGFIRAGAIPTGQGLLYASIYPRTDRSDLQASITGRVFTRYKFLDISFRTLTRASTTITALITGLGVGSLDMSAYIKGLPHENDLTASVTAVRYRLNKPEPLENIKVYKWVGANVTLYKELMLTFSSQVSEYVYDAIDSAVYPMGDGRWALNLSEFTEVDSFYDRDPNDRSRPIDDITEYDSIDEAIRAAIVLLTELYRSDLTASITATGGCYGLSADIYGLRQDKVSDLAASVTLVTNIPDLYASISAYSGYNPLVAFIVGEDSGHPDIEADIRGVVYTGIGADITAVI